MGGMKRYERENIAAMRGYAPGEQPASRDVVKLNTNENPYPPSAAVMRALGEVDAEALRRYPNPTARGFRERAAGLHQVEPDQVIATNGGDELLRLLITTFVDPGRPIGYPEPSYSLYPVLAAVHGSPVHRVALDADWSLPADLAARMNEAGVQLTFVVNPHAPSGALTDVATLRRLAEGLEGLLVVDEAYVDFVDPALAHDAVELVRDGSLGNVVLLRSLSKGYSLAGLRFGYGLGPAALIEPMLSKTKDSYNTDVVGQRLAEAAIGDPKAAAANWAAVRRERARLTEALAGMGFVVSPSESNFVLATAPDGRAAALHEALKRRGIYVRYFEDERLGDKLRITVGSAADNEALLTAVGELV